MVTNQRLALDDTTRDTERPRQPGPLIQWFSNTRATANYIPLEARPPCLRMYIVIMLRTSFYTGDLCLSNTIMAYPIPLVAPKRKQSTPKATPLSPNPKKTATAEGKSTTVELSPPHASKKHKAEQSEAEDTTNQNATL